MGNAQEAIEEYEAKTADVRKMDIDKTTEPNTYRTVRLIVDHLYQDSTDVWYLAQWKDGHQQWVKPPERYCFEWIKKLEEYWNNQ